MCSERSTRSSFFVGYKRNDEIILHCLRSHIHRGVALSRARVGSISNQQQASSQCEELEFIEISIVMQFLIAADIVYQLMSTKLAGRAGCAQIEQRAQSKELRKVPREYNYSTHRSAALRGFRNTLKRRPRVATVAFDGRYMG